MKRRALLGAVAVGAAGLAGCLSSGSDSPNPGVLTVSNYLAEASLVHLRVRQDGDEIADIETEIEPRDAEGPGIVDFGCMWDEREGHIEFDLQVGEETVDIDMADYENDCPVDFDFDLREDGLRATRRIDCTPAPCS